MAVLWLPLWYDRGGYTYGRRVGNFMARLNLTWVEIVGGTVPGGDGFDRINIMSSEISLT